MVFNVSFCKRASSLCLTECITLETLGYWINKSFEHLICESFTSSPVGLCFFIKKRFSSSDVAHFEMDQEKKNGFFRCISL